MVILIYCETVFKYLWHPNQQRYQYFLLQPRTWQVQNRWKQSTYLALYAGFGLNVGMLALVAPAI
jgi:hypothetical protein